MIRRARNFAVLLVLVLAVVQARPSRVMAGESSTADGLRVEIRIVDGARAWPETNRWSAEVITPDGTRLYRIERVVPYDFPYPTLTVADNGSGVLLDAAQGRVEFLTPRGEVIAAWSPFASPVPSYERIIKCSIGTGTAAFLLSEPDATEVRVVTTDLSGSTLSETTMPGTTAGEIIVAPDDSAILASATVDGDPIRHMTRLLGREATILLEAPILFRVANFEIEAGQFLFADRYTVVGGSLTGPATRFQSAISGGNRIVTAVRPGADRALVVTEEIEAPEGVPEYRDAEVVLLENNGTVIERTRLQSISASPATVTPVDDEFIVRAGAKTARFRLATPR